MDTFQIALQYRDFRLVWVGNFFSQGAQWVQVLTIGWLVLKLTDGNALLTGTVVGIRTFPVLLIGPWAGVLADRVDRRKLIIIAQLGMAAAAIVFAFLVIATDLESETPSGPLRWWHPFIYMIIAGVAHSFIQPVRNALVANTVPRQDLVRAMTLNSMAFPTTRIVAPAVGGIIIATLGFNWNFFLEALAYIIMVGLMIPVRLPYSSQDRQSHVSALTSLRDGIAYVWQEKPVLQLIVMSFIPNMLFTPLLFILPVFTQRGAWPRRRCRGDSLGGHWRRRNSGGSAHNYVRVHSAQGGGDFLWIDWRLPVHIGFCPINLVCSFDSNPGMPGVLPVLLQDGQ